MGVGIVADDGFVAALGGDAPEIGMREAAAALVGKTEAGNIEFQRRSDRNPGRVFVPCAV
jgi:hypothetical protein